MTNNTLNRYTKKGIKVFFFYAESNDRSRALSYSLKNGQKDNLSKVFLFGYDDLLNDGYSVTCNIGNEKPKIIDRIICWLGSIFYKKYFSGFNGRWNVVAKSLSVAREYEVVFAFTDAIALPLLTLKSIGLFHPRIVYVSVGLSERIKKYNDKSTTKTALIKKVLSQAERIISYGYGEAIYIKDYFKKHTLNIPVNFIPFGVDTNQWRPSDRRKYEYDVFCAGTDPNRDIECYFKLARSFPNKTFVWVTRDYIASQWPVIPENVIQFREIDMDKSRELMLKSKIIALPVKENLYSGANITILLNMALAKPIVVSRTDAIKDGYGLINYENCLLSKPGNDEEFIERVSELFLDEKLRKRLGENGRRCVEKLHTWQRFVDDLAKFI